MVITSDSLITSTTLKITWEKLPDNFQLEDEPVENTGQPLIAAALRETLDVIGFLKSEMLIASNFGLCATINNQLVIKAPDWVYVPSVKALAIQKDRKSYTPNLEGDIPSVVMEFLSDTDGSEYSIKRSYPPGKWFFYEQILEIPIYVIFEPVAGVLEVYHLEGGKYELAAPNPQGLYWIAPMNLFLGVWQGKKSERNGYWLRWWDKSEKLLPWALEKIAQEQQKAEKLAEYLRSQGINPDEIA